MTRLYKYGDNSIFLYSQRSFSPQALHFSGAEDQQNYPYFNLFRSFSSFLPNNLYMSFKVVNTVTTERLSDRTEYCDKRVSAGWDAAPPVRSEGFLPCIQSVQSCRVRLFATPLTAASQASLSITNSQSLLKLMSIESVMPSNHLILCRPLLLTSILPSTRVFSNDSVLHIRWPKYWSFSFSFSHFNEYSGWIDWLDLLAVQGTFKSLLQHYSSEASILQCSAFFRVQLSHPYMTTG